MRGVTMSFLVRKITRSKWPDDFCELHDIKADAYTDLRTTNNALSFWKIEEERELEDVMLALATGPNCSLEKVTVAWVDEEELQSKGIEIETSEGDTVIDDLKKTPPRCLCVDLCVTWAGVAFIAERYAGREMQTISAKRSKECCC